MNLKRIKTEAMNRKLILIENAGTKGSLTYAGIDIDNYEHFFRRPKGGAWEDDEIFRPDANTLTLVRLKYLLGMWNALQPLDYVVIVFCGHGYLNPDDGLTYLEISPNNDCSVSDIRGAVKDTRCLLITDSCRAVPLMESGGRIADTRLFSATAHSDTIYRQNCRDLYNRHVLAMPCPSFTAVYSVSPYQSASADDENGGVFSYCLLSMAKKMITISMAKRLAGGITTKSVITLQELMTDVKNAVVYQTTGAQRPVYQGLRSGIQPPFMVVEK